MSQRSLSKTVKYYKEKEASKVAKESANKFTKKQSQFERRQEEQQIREAGEDNRMSRFESARRESVSASRRQAPVNVMGSKFMSGSGDKRANIYRLDDAAPSAGKGAQAVRQLERDDRSSSGLGSLLGATTTSNKVVEEDRDGLEEGEAPHKKSRQEKFQEIVANSRALRLEHQKEAAVRDKQTTELDAEFDTVMHLLQKRDRLQEERDAFLSAGSSEVKNLLQDFKTNRTAKVFKLDGTGSLQSGGAASSSAEGAAANAAVLDAADRALLAKLTHTDPKKIAVAPPTQPITKSQQMNEDDSEDDFDLLMNTMRQETKKAHAVDRTLTEEEEEQQLDQLRQLQADRGIVPTVSTEDEQLTRKEWLSRGGVKAYHMDDDEGNAEFDYEESEEGEEDEDEEGNGEEQGEDDEEAAAATVGSSNPVDRILAELEQFSTKAGSITVAARSSAYQEFLTALYAQCKRHPLHATQSFRLLLMDAQRRVYQKQPLSPFLMLVLHAIPHIFPASDYRHEVMTPYIIFLCSTLTQTSFQSLEDVKRSIVLCSLLVDVMRMGGKFCSEMLVTPLNIIALQVPKVILQPVAHQGVQVPFPLLDRCEGALFHHGVCLTPDDKDGTTMTAPLELCAAVVEPADQLLYAAYKLLAAVAFMHANNAAFPCAVAHPMKRLSEVMGDHVVPALRRTHEAALQTINEMEKQSQSHRTPLAMRSFRPRPIRLFEPLLVEVVDPELKERRELKKEVREDRKRLVRQVQAEATVERRSREKEAQAESSRREAKYHELMGELQAQQHTMKSVDMSLAKARSKKKKSMSGSTNNGSEAAEQK